MNPILNQLNNNNILSLLSSLKGTNTQEMYKQMLSTNPKFREFIEANKGKTVDQIASEHGIDINQIKNLMR